MDNENKIGQNEHSNEKSVSDSVKKLSGSFVDLFGRDLNRVSECLKEAIIKQAKFQEELSTLNQEYSIESRKEGQKLFDDIKIYTERLHSISKQMINIHQRARALKKRAENVKIFKEREIMAIRQKQLHEESLIARSSVPQYN